MNTQTHVIVGAGQTGSHAAMAMREAGFSGRIVLVGDERHLPYDRPPLSKAFITADTPPEASLFFAAPRYDAADIELVLGRRVGAVDPNAARVEFEDGTRIPYDRLVLATGSRARRLTLPGAEHVLTIRSLDDALAVRAALGPGSKVVCIGAGVIGLEMGASARARGCDVTILEAGSTLMGRSLHRDMADAILALHRRHGIDIRFNVAIAAIEPDRVVCADGTAFAADLIIAGIGVERNTELAVAAGLAVGPGIHVDARGRTAREAIYAAGEVASYFVPRLGRRLNQESWRHAQEHGAFVGRVLAGQTGEYDEVPWFWSDQHGVNIQVAGTIEDHVTTIERGDRQTGRFSTFYLDAGGHLVGVVGINAARDVAAGLRLIRNRMPVDATVLADDAIPAQKLVSAAVYARA
jgi:3-phenylpropionate/trans-cinnamate dioxygenase ferredoxin reductase subunit